MTASQLSKFQTAKVLVVGDVMLDRYWFGDVTRISPEAPVPVAKICKTDHRAGGAANVARNIAALGGQVALLSVVGDDEAADILTDLLHQDGIANCLHRSPHTPTTLKLRVLAHNQQLIRLDFEETPDKSSLKTVLQHYADLLTQYDAVILSDYGKGVLSNVAVMIAGLVAKAQKLREDLDLQALLVTRSEEGMSLFRQDKIDHQPTQAQEVYDVSGAGDTVIATMGLCLAAGYDLPDAMRTANAAAGVVVAKLGTAVCSYQELAQALAE